MSDAPGDDEPVRLVLGDELDLHAFHPREAAGIVADYLDHAVAHHWPRVRIIHGKGTGALRETVHAVLRRHAAVARFGLAPDGGGWGATVVELRAVPEASR